MTVRLEAPARSHSSVNGGRSLCFRQVSWRLLRSQPGPSSTAANSFGNAEGDAPTAVRLHDLPSGDACCLPRNERARSPIIGKDENSSLDRGGSTRKQMRISEVASGCSTQRQFTPGGDVKHFDGEPLYRAGGDVDGQGKQRCIEDERYRPVGGDQTPKRARRHGHVRDL